MKKKWLMLIITVALIAVAVALYFIFAGKGNQRSAVSVNTATVQKGSIKVTVSGSGSAVASVRQTLKPSAAGKIAKVLVKEGDTVKKGQVLFTYEGEDKGDEIKQEELNLQKQQIDLISTQQQFKEKTAAGEDTGDLQKQIDKMLIDIELANDKIKSLKESENPPDPVTAPIAGEITSLSVNAGDQVNENSEIGEIVDYSQLTMTIQVDELDIDKIKQGMQAELQFDALPDQTIAGEVTKIGKEGTASNGVSVFDVTLNIKDTAGIKAGMSGQAVITIQEKKDILMVPIEAVQKIGNRHVVFVPASSSESNSSTPGSQTNTPTNETRTQSRSWRSGAQNSSSAGAASTRRSGSETFTGGANRQMKTVEVGVNNENYIEIVSGLTEGEQVIIPTVVSNSNNSAQLRGGFGGIGGFGGMGGFGDMGESRRSVSGGSGGGGGSR
ncbi:efflux RND transporter periplasmic adaptor subunit [Paenibacillus sediminis]|uniref:HlyD family secretion protein n=1 Tax=Paenibacillus sediminis TaxID=664909 RepID=A0ABS4H4G6_9BACL|nr:efflux RND transporter periplasmic adaptor subunit [Paenibacillus sediminis]MBP1937418.1 HlyD family secretion protein [Paenibacillus sediminis]